MSTITFAAVPITIVLAFVPHFVKRFFLHTAKPADTDLENNPREALTKAIEEDKNGNGQVLARAAAAHNNQLEGLPIFYGALVFAILAGVPQRNVDAVALVYMITRVIYIYLYLSGTSRLQGLSRSVVWIIGFIANLYLMVHAACLAPKIAN